MNGKHFAFSKPSAFSNSSGVVPWDAVGRGLLTYPPSLVRKKENASGQKSVF